MIFDFDDFGEGKYDCRKKLGALKVMNPAFKVTLFTIPAKTPVSMLIWAKKRSWIELAVHGWTHEPNTECNKWTYEQCRNAITDTMVRAFYTKGFKAPGWQISDECYAALKNHGFWVADQHYNDERRPKDLKVYHVGENSYHGHTWDCGCNNGIYEDWKNIVKKVKEAKEFQFISEVIDGM